MKNHLFTTLDAYQEVYPYRPAYAGPALHALSRVEVASAELVVAPKTMCWWEVEPYHNGAATALRRLTETWEASDCTVREPNWHVGLSFAALATLVGSTPDRSDDEALVAGAEAMMLLDRQPHSGFEVWVTMDTSRPGALRSDGTVRRVRLHELVDPR